MPNIADFHFQCIATRYKRRSSERHNIWTASSEFGTNHLCEQRRFRRACASAQSRQNLRCSLIQAVSQEEPSERKPDPWPLWMAGHAQLKFVMTECSRTQIRLTGLIWYICCLKSSLETRISDSFVYFYLSPVKRICVFEHSVTTSFNCACPAIQRGQGSGFLSESSSWLTAYMSEQRRFWRDCADAQARLNLRCSHRR